MKRTIRRRTQITIESLEITAMRTRTAARTEEPDGDVVFDDVMAGKTDVIRVSGRDMRFEAQDDAITDIVTALPEGTTPQGSRPIE